MKKTPTTQTIYNLIILDESGSMQPIKQQVINGFNETVQTIKSAQKTHKNQKHFVSLVTFSDADKIRTVYDKIEVNQVEELTEETYQPCASTPLYDAMGIALTSLKKTAKSNDKVLVTVITDGYENASREYNAQSIKNLVESLKTNGWIFAYIGANQDVIREASKISITNTLHFMPTSFGTEKMHKQERASRAKFYTALAEDEHTALKCARTAFFKSDEE